MKSRWTLTHDADASSHFNRPHHCHTLQLSFSYELRKQCILQPCRICCETAAVQWNRASHDANNRGLMPEANSIDRWQGDASISVIATWLWWTFCLTAESNIFLQFAQTSCSSPRWIMNEVLRDSKTNAFVSCSTWDMGRHAYIYIY
jgi:hypothetical protein